MNGQKVIATEYLMSVAIVSWAPVKKGFYPWPPSIVATSVAYSLLSFLALISEELAVTLGAGFLVAQIVKMASGTSKIPDLIYQDMTTNKSGSGDRSLFEQYSLGFDGTLGQAGQGR